MGRASRCTSPRSCPPICGPSSCATGGAVVHAESGDLIALNGGPRSLAGPYAAHRQGSGCGSRPSPPLSRAHILAVHGHHPVRYVRGAGRSRRIRTCNATEPGSAEMPSAGRPFTPEVLTGWWRAAWESSDRVAYRRGIARKRPNRPTRVLPGDACHRPQGQRHAARGWAVIAVGTTVVRALETVVDSRKEVHAGHGWTDTV